jgi:hypothetical protein
MPSQLRTQGLKPSIYQALAARLKPCPSTALPTNINGKTTRPLDFERCYFISPISYFELALQIVLDIHRGCAADYAAGWEPRI